MASPEFPPLELQLRHIPTEHLQEVPVPLDSYTAIAETIIARPTITRDEFKALCDEMPSAHMSGKTLTAEQQLAAFEQLQADGVLSLVEQDDQTGTFGVLPYKAPIPQVTLREARRETARSSRDLHRAYKKNHRGSTMDLQLGRMLVGNQIAAHASGLRRLLGKHAVAMTQAIEEQPVATNRRGTTPEIDPTVQRWAEERKTIPAFQPPAIDLLRPDEIDVQSVKGAELFSRESLKDSVVEIYMRYMAGLAEQDFTPKEALQYRSEVAEKYAQELLKKYYPTEIPTVLVATLTDTMLRFSLSREGMLSLRQYQGAIRDISEAKEAKKKVNLQPEHAEESAPATAGSSGVEYQQYFEPGWLEDLAARVNGAIRQAVRRERDERGIDKLPSAEFRLLSDRIAREQVKESLAADFEGDVPPELIEQIYEAQKRAIFLRKVSKH